MNSPSQIYVSGNWPPQAEGPPWTVGLLCSHKQHPHPEQQAKAVCIIFAQRLPATTWLGGLGKWQCFSEYISLPTNVLTPLK